MLLTTNYKIIQDLNITIKESPGSTPDNKVNIEWHRDLFNLSAQKVLEIAEVICRQAEKERILGKDIKKLIAEHISLGDIDKSKLEQKILEEVHIR